MWILKQNKRGHQGEFNLLNNQIIKCDDDDDDDDENEQDGKTFDVYC